MSILEGLDAVGAVYTNDHLVLTSGRHSPVYVNMRAIAPEVTLVDDIGVELAKIIAGDLRSLGIDQYALVGPETLGRTLAAAVALYTADGIAFWCDITGEGEEKTAALPTKMQFETRLTPGTKAVVVDDLLTSGSSVKPVISMLRNMGVGVLGVAVVVRRNPNVTADTLEVPHLWTLEEVDGGETYPADACPMCAAGQPLRLRPGHGWKFAEEHPDHPSVLTAIN
jgi:orotate phosphoribosyltransferase